MIKLVIVEQDVNYPTVLGRLNVPKKQRWPAGSKLATIPSVIAAGMDRSFLPQRMHGQNIVERALGLPARGTGLLTGTAAARRFPPRGPLQRLARHREVVGSELAVSGEYSAQVHNAVHAQTERNIPQAWGPRKWRPGALLQNLPSVVQTGITSGPTRTMHGKLIPTGMSVEM